jgi:2-polyprenyl-6-methoxyphenol hydroxylase-like FAD-dependent oxidoreductase
LETIDTLIIGAGPAGLTTACSLAKAGHGVIVIEQDKHYVGGIRGFWSEVQQGL